MAYPQDLVLNWLKQWHVLLCCFGQSFHIERYKGLRSEVAVAPSPDTPSRCSSVAAALQQRCSSVAAALQSGASLCVCFD